jgi:acyl carrier protein
VLLSEYSDRLQRCFASVFPGATADEIRTAKLEDISGWDSLRGVTLLAVIDEEFGLQLDLSELTELGTFEGIRDYIAKREQNTNG